MEYRDRIRLDRYAIKNPDADLKPGDMVVASMTRVFERDGREVESREIGYVLNQSTDGTYAVTMDATGETEAGIPRERLEYVVETSYEDICTRLATTVATVEKKKNQKKFAAAVKEAMVAERFVPAGRILAGLGRNDYDLTLFNCYVFNIKSDSRKGITDHWGRLFETYSRGGGVGTPLSILRPKGSVVRKVNGRSSGSVSWAEQFSQITGAVEQGGSRRGASLLGQWCWHPDIIDFIDAKAQREDVKLADGSSFSRNKNLISNANVSVMITNDFMQAVKDDGDWNLIFPDTKDPEYDTKWDGDIWTWRDKLNKKVITYQTVKARKIWERIIQRAWESGEPGLLFTERANDMSNSWYHAVLLGTNPCGEVFLPDNGVCNLAHLNLSKYVQGVSLPEKNNTAEEAINNFDTDQLKKDIRIGIRFLDNVNNLNKYHDDEVEKQQLSERRIGLGILGYGDMLIRLGLRYGSDEALNFTDHLMKTFTCTAYEESCLLATERGSFPAFNAKKFLSSGFMKQMPETIRQMVAMDGIRNVTCTTIAPTGSIASMLNTSTGCEPFFDLQYTSTTRIGVVTEHANIAATATQQFGERKNNNWPNYIVTAQNGITPEEHVRTQAVLQRWIDQSISKTINMPHDATAKDVSDAYMLMWELGCKGGTVYRDGSRDVQVLYTDKKEDKVPVQIVEATTGNAVVRPRPDVGMSITFSEESPIGTVHLTIRHDQITGDPIDVFVTTGKGDSAADGEAIGRLMSMILRFPDGANINQQTRLQLIHGQLVDILGRGQVGFGPEAKRSMPDTIAKILDRYLKADFPIANLPYGLQPMKELLDEMAGAGGDAEKIGYIRKYILEGDPGNGHENDTYLEEMEAEIQKAEEKGMKLPYDYCPGCGNCTLVIVPGKCPFCRTCGFTQC